MPVLIGFFKENIRFYTKIREILISSKWFLYYINYNVQS